MLKVRQQRATRTDQRVRVIRTLENRGNRKAALHFRGHVLHRMNGHVCISVLHGDFEFFDEQALTAYLLQAAIENLIAARRQRQQLDGIDAR